MLYRLGELQRSMDIGAQPSVEARHCGGVTYKTSKMLQCLSVLLMLRNRSDYKNTLKKALAASLPESIMGSFIQKLDSSKLPSASSLSKNQAIFDAALTVLYRQLYPLQDFWIYLWADASPQGPLGEMFLTEMLIVRKDNMRTAWTTAMALASLHVHAPTEDDDFHSTVFADSATDLLTRRAALAAQLEPMLVQLINMPQFLAPGAASLANKVRSLLFILWMYAAEPRHDAVSQFCRNIVAFTTDMGTELGIFLFIL